MLDSEIQLKLADGSKFNQTAEGNAVTIEAMFNNETGNYQVPRRLFRTRTACCATARPAPC